MSRRPIHRGPGWHARPVDVRDTRWNPLPEPGTRPCPDPRCDGVMRPAGFHVPPMRGRGPAGRGVPARTVTVWTCAICARQLR